jgi:hypothetical protein
LSRRVRDTSFNAQSLKASHGLSGGRTAAVGGGREVEAGSEELGCGVEAGSEELGVGRGVAVGAGVPGAEGTAVGVLAGGDCAGLLGVGLGVAVGVGPGPSDTGGLVLG